MNPNQQRIDRLRELEAQFDARPPATMDSSLKRRRELLDEIYELRRIIPQTIYNGTPSPIMTSQTAWQTKDAE